MNSQQLQSNNKYCCFNIKDTPMQNEENTQAFLTGMREREKQRILLGNIDLEQDESYMRTKISFRDIKKSPFLKQDNYQQETNLLEKKSFRCKFCDEEYKDFRRLGSHIRSHHPGKSSHYSNMKTIRNRRELDRKAFQLAKEKLQEQLRCEEVPRGKLRGLKHKILD